MSDYSAAPQQIGFADAVRRGFERYTMFSGRASRAEYWWWFLFGFLASVLASVVDLVIGTNGVAGGFGVVNLLLALALLSPNIAIGIRRLHDTNRSGWWLLIALVPCVGFIVLLVFYVMPGTPGPNDHGPPSV